MKRIIKKLLVAALFLTMISPILGSMNVPAKAAGAVDGIESGKTYYLRAKHSDKCLDLKSSSVASGTHFQQYAQGDASELFKICLWDDGYYTLETTLVGAGGNMMVMDGRSNCVAGAQVILYPYRASLSEQKWEIRKNANGTYCLSPKKNPSLNLAVEGWSYVDNAKVKLEDKKDTMYNQQWYIEDPSKAMNIYYYDNQEFYLSNKHSGKYLDLQGNGKTNGTNFQQYRYIGEFCSERVTLSLCNDGYFKIKSAYASPRVMDGRSNCVAGAQVILYDDLNASEQRWHIRKNDNGTFSFSPKKNVYLNMGVEGASEASNAKVKLADRDFKAPEQQWCLEPVEGSTGFKGYGWRYAFENSDFAHICSGYLTYSNRKDPHYAIDIVSRSATPIAGAPILAPMAGTVIKKENHWSAGNYVVVAFDSFWTGTGGTNKLNGGFMHMRDPARFDVGDKVKKGDVLGYVGGTGNADGFNHLDLSVFFYGEWPSSAYGLNPQRFFPWANFTGDLSNVRP